MDRKSRETTVIHSSVALLQERFRQLQRVKAMREEQEVLRMLALSDSEPKQIVMTNSNHTMHYEPARARLFLKPHHLDRGREASASRVSLSLWPTLQSKHDDHTHRKTESLLLINLWPTVARTASLNTCSNKFEDSESDSDSDVDTSPFVNELKLLPVFM